MRCVHCLEETGDTKDHVFPSSWYPTTTPQEIQRPKAPSCGKCNESLGQHEQKLLLRIGICIDPKKLEASGIHKKILHSFGIGKESELSQRELGRRRKALDKFLGEMGEYTPETKTFPGFGPHEGFPPNTQSTIQIPAESLMKVSHKIVRGLEYVNMKGRYIDPPYQVKTYFVEENEGLADVYQLFAQHGVKRNYGPGFTVERAQGDKGTWSAVIYRIEIWKTLILYASIMDPTNT